MTERGEEGHGLPATIWDLGPEPASPRRPSPERRHVGLGPSLIEEDQAAELNPVLIGRPLRAPTRDVGAVLFAGEHGFFEAQRLGMDEIPYRVVIDLETTRGQLGHQPA